jgi:hypothetical protein
VEEKKALKEKVVLKKREGSLEWSVQKVCDRLVAKGLGRQKKKKKVGKGAE